MSDELYAVLQKKQNVTATLCQDESREMHCPERLDLEREGVTGDGVPRPSGVRMSSFVSVRTGYVVLVL